MTANKTQSVAMTGIFAAIVILLQVFATAINIITPGTIPVALVLPPIIVGAAMGGIKVGMILGFCFGAVVLGSGIFGFAPTSTMMWGVSPLIMTVGTLGRGLAVGFTAGAVYKLFAKRSPFFGVIAAAVAVPLVNTGIFTIVFFLFVEVLAEEVAGQPFFFYVSMFVLVFNFVLELIFNVVLAPTITRIIQIVQKRKA